MKKTLVFLFGLLTILNSHSQIFGENFYNYSTFPPSIIIDIDNSIWRSNYANMRIDPDDCYSILIKGIRNDLPSLSSIKRNIERTYYVDKDESKLNRHEFDNCESTQYVNCDVAKFNLNSNRGYIVYVNLYNVEYKHISLGDTYNGNTCYNPFDAVELSFSFTMFNLIEENNYNINKNNRYCFGNSNTCGKQLVKKVLITYSYKPEVIDSKYPKAQLIFDAIYSFVKSKYLATCLNELLKISGTILQASKANKDGTDVKEVYIDLGEHQKVSKGEEFDVIINNKIIGNIEAINVVSDNRTICKVKSGGKVIADALKKKYNITIRNKSIVNYSLIVPEFVPKAYN